MGHEPSALERDSQHPMKLVGAHALLTGAHEMNRGEPLVQWDVAVGEDRAHRHSELLTASSALVDALPRLASFLGLDLVGFADHAAMRANRAVWPALGFQHFAGFIGVLKLGGKQVGFNNNP